MLLLDEAFAGLSVEERRDVLTLINDIPRDVTIVMIEHDMDVALGFAERDTVLHFGQVIVEGPAPRLSTIRWRMTRRDAKARRCRSASASGDLLKRHPANTSLALRLATLAKVIRVLSGNLTVVDPAVTTAVPKTICTVLAP